MGMDIINEMVIDQEKFMLKQQVRDLQEENQRLRDRLRDYQEREHNRRPEEGKNELP